VFFSINFVPKITAGKVIINFTREKGFHILFQHCASVIRPHVIHDG